MRVWPFSRVEKRSDAGATEWWQRFPYPELEAYLAGGQWLTDALASIETAAGLWARCFATAQVASPSRRTAALDADVLATIGRALVRRGESLHLIEVRNGRIRLVEACAWEVAGEVDWHYRIDMAQPRGLRTVAVGAESVLHCRYAWSPDCPWRGLSPLHFARATKNLAEVAEKQLRGEFAAPYGSVMNVGPQPQLGAGGPTTKTQADDLRDSVRKMAGGVLLVNNDQGGNPVQRFGPNPPASIAELRAAVNDAILSACGIPPNLQTKQVAGNAAREALRQLLHTTIAPAAKQVAAECSRKLEVPVAFDFGQLFASDITGRSRAYAGLVGAGMEAEKAERISGLSA